MSLTILLPCLNEAETLEVCISKARASLEDLNLIGEVLVADNGSTDGSQNLAKKSGARVIEVKTKGYGAALIAGINDSKTDYVIMGDADDSYALDDLLLFVRKLDEGYDLVMGNRFLGGISPGAMPWLHKYLGNPILSWLGKLLFKAPIGDFHCGLRGFRVEAIRNLNLKSTGMEFASEMVVKSSLNGLKIAEVPTSLKPDGRSRAPHLRTWRDGWRHLIFLLTASPRYLFLYPGLLLFAVGLIGFALTFSGEIDLFNLFLSSNTYFLSISLMIVGVQTILMAILARIYSSRIGILPQSKQIANFQKHFTLERGVVFGLVLIFLGFIGIVILFSDWNGSGFHNLSTIVTLRISGAVILSTLAGVQILFASFFAWMIQSN
jgi:glycosyltransferase involved in cell wall biosynthesis